MPLYQHGPYDEAMRRRVTQADVQHSRLIYLDLEDKLDHFCRYVPAIKSHLGVYSTKLWGVILRSCAEIDSQLHALIEEQEGKSRDTNIFDYIASEASFQLSSFQLQTRFESHPIQPFASFATGASPSWWKDYNSVKHRRLESLESATLENALSAVGGLYVVLLRQWGEYIMPRQMTLVCAQQIAESPPRLFAATKMPW